MISKKLFSLAMMAAISVLTAANVFAEVANISVSLGSDASTEVGINWSSPTSVDAAAVVYGISQGLYPFEQQAVEVNDAAGIGVFYEARITDLMPDTIYYFAVGSGDDMSEELTFKTGPVPNPVYGEFSFMVWGDSRGGDESINAELDDLLNYVIANHRTEMHFFTGDATYAELDDELTAWLGAVEEYNKITPIFATAGNHDIDMAKFYSMFALPQNEDNVNLPEAYFSVDYANVHFVVLNDNFLFGVNSNDVTEWLRQDLAETDKLWKFVFHHRPLYSSCNHGNAEDLIGLWEEIYNEYGVDIVFSGHDHNYERSYPLNRLIGSGGVSEVADNPWEGTTYIVSNGMGDNLYSSGSNYWTAYSESRTNYSVITISNDTIDMIAVDPIQDEVFDQLTYTKPVSPEMWSLADSLLTPDAKKSDDDDGFNPFGCSSITAGSAGDAAFILLLSLLLSIAVKRVRNGQNIS